SSSWACSLCCRLWSTCWWPPGAGPSPPVLVAAFVLPILCYCSVSYARTGHFWLARRQPSIGRLAAAAAGGVALTAPLLLLSLSEQRAVGWINRPSLTDLRVLVQDYFGANTLVIVLLIGCAAAAVVPPPRAWRETAWWRSGGVSLPSVAAPLLVVPAAILIGESIVAVPLYVDRYVLYGEAGAALLAGAGCYRAGRWLRAAAGRRALIWVPGVIVCLCVLLLQLAPQHRVRTPGSRRYDYGGPSRYIAEHARPGDGILFFGKFYRKAELGYPGDFRNTSDFAMAVSPLRAGDFQGRDKPFAVTYPLMLAHRRIWVFGTRPSTRRAPGLISGESMALERRFTLIDRHRFHGILVTLWLRR
ncbi:MAG TPA: hypothetical protein VF256_17250, partial [Streptosporangiaceae bacterium]